MESFFTRYRNPAILTLVLLAQVLGLAVQVKRPVDPNNPDAGTVRLMRSWVVGAISPVEKLFISTSRFVRHTWHDYINVVGLRSENRELREQNEKLHMELARQADSANQAQRLQELLDFKQRFVGTTIAAQVIGSSGTEFSRVIYIDKGSRDGIRPEMAVITPHGIVGKVRDVYRSVSQVMMINDASSGLGAIVENSRLHGVVKGTPDGELILAHIMADEKVEEGERLVTSGGDRIFPKGLPVGTVSQVSPGPELFLNIHIKPGANLTRLEEVLVITEVQGEQIESASGETPLRASDILAQRLPSVPKKPEPAPAQNRPKTQQSAAPGQLTGTGTTKPAVRGSTGGSARTTTPAGNMATGTSLKPNGATSKAAKPTGSAAVDVNSSATENGSKPETEAAPPVPQPDAGKPANPQPNGTAPPATGAPAKPPANPPAREAAKPAQPEDQ